MRQLIICDYDDWNDRVRVRERVTGDKKKDAIVLIAPNEQIFQFFKDQDLDTICGTVDAIRHPVWSFAEAELIKQQYTRK